MSQSMRIPTPAARKRPGAAKPPQQAQKRTGPGNRDLLSGLGAGRAMPGGVQAKMESALGADFSGVRLYESPLVARAGAQAAASGDKVAFAPGELDLGSGAGLDLLGHELSHVASQARGEVPGSGLVRDAALERRADDDGARAMRAFDSVSGADLSPMSTAPAPASPAAPIQAKKKKEPPQSAGDRFKAGYADQDLSGQVESMRNMALTASVDPDMDKSETDTYYDMLGGLSNEFVDEMINQQLAAAGRLNQTKADMTANNGEEGDLAGAKGAFDAKYSMDASLFQGFSSLVFNMGMAESPAFHYYRERMQALATENPEANAALQEAQGTIMSNDEKNAWATAHAGGEADDVREAAQDRELLFAKNWHRPEAPKKQGLLSRLFRRKR